MSAPPLSNGLTEEKCLCARWDLFKAVTQLTVAETTQQLFQCCEEALGNDLLRGDPDIISQPEANVLQAIKKLAVIPVAISVRRSDLLSISQCD